MKPRACISATSSFVKIVSLIVVGFIAAAARVNAANHPLTVAVSLDIPPYVMDHAHRGVEVYIVHMALPNYRMKWVQMDYAELESAVSDKKADIAMSVQTRKPNVYYSMDYIGFANVAISKKADHLKIEDVADLKGHPVLTWQNACTELGDEFKNQYAPGSPERTNYIEVADQAEQVRRFWEGKGKVIVIDRSIFDYLSEQQGHSLNDVEYHALFPKITKFRVAFADATLRDEFNAGFKRLRETARYRRILKLYHVPDLVGGRENATEREPSAAQSKP